MSSAKITLLGFYNWMNDAGEDLFAAFDDLPAGVDKDDLVANILLRGGEFEVLYSDPVFMQQAITPWLHKWRRTIEKWITALSIEYEPLYNYDRYEEWTDNRLTSGNKDTTLSRKEDETSIDAKSGESQDANTYTKSGNLNTSGSTSETHSGTVTTENTVSAFDSSSYSPKDYQTVTDGTGIGTTNSQSTTSGSVDHDDLGTKYSESLNGKRNATGSETGKETTDGKDDLKHKGHLYGNIGVVSSQEMLTQELEVARFNLIDQITDLFLPEFIIPVYV